MKATGQHTVWLAISLLGSSGLQADAKPVADITPPRSQDNKNNNVKYSLKNICYKNHVSSRH